MDKTTLRHRGIDKLTKDWAGKGPVFWPCQTSTGVTVALLAFFDFEHLGAVFLAQTWDPRDEAPQWRFVLVHWTPPSSVDQVVLVHEWPLDHVVDGPPIVEAAVKAEAYIRTFASTFNW